MDEVRTPLVLEMLNEETATFIGGDVSTIQREFLGRTLEFEGRYPIVHFARSTWESMGCPTSLMLTLAEYVSA
jgi:hypothetical protein